VKTTFEAWFCGEVCSFIRFLWAKCFYPIEIHCQLEEVYSASVVTVKVIGKWRREFENGTTDICHDNRTDRFVTSRADVNAARVGKLIFGKRSRLSTVLHIISEEVEAAIHE
jgi:hypothetical protein